MNTGCRLLLIFVVVLLLAAAGVESNWPGWKGLIEPALAQSSQVDKKAVESRLANVKRLIETSSGARRIRSSGNAQANEMLEQAGELHLRAEERFRAGDAQGSNVLLEKATLAVFEAVRLTGTPEVLQEKKHADFEQRAESIDALLGALERIGEEKGRKAEVSTTIANVEQLVGEAKSLEAAGEKANGRLALDAAYDLAKRAIEELRGGDTLVRSLKFESKEEEFLYELDRNDTHKMLVRVLLEEKRKSDNVDRMVRSFVERADALRLQAEQSARSGDFQTAVEGLEKSTKELVRAIRGAGVYIPG
jgi:hypothetical protein